MTMDIDSPSGVEEPQLFIHPLALIHMSDQYTRVRMGGSPLVASAPVTGILFGKEISGSCFIEDANDIPLKSAQTQIDLHQAVFPNQQVMGWYKVVASNDSNEPTAHDLQQTRQIQTDYQSNSTDNNSNPPLVVFGLLQVPRAKPPKDDAGDARMKTEGDQEELPLTLFRLEGGVLVAASTWTLQTAESERIAVQRVIREKADATDTSDVDTGPVESKTLLPYTEEVMESCDAIAARLSLILQYLQSLPSPWPLEHAPLLRQVHGLLLQLGPIAATRASSPLEADAKLQQLASLTKAVDSVTLYAEKFRFLHEHAGRGGGSSREMRRFT